MYDLRQALEDRIEQHEEAHESAVQQTAKIEAELAEVEYRAGELRRELRKAQEHELACDVALAMERQKR